MQYIMIISSDFILQIELNMNIYRVQSIELVLYSNPCIKPYNYAFPYRCFKVTNIMLSIHSTGIAPFENTKDFKLTQTCML